MVTWISLTEAALRLKRSYPQTLRLVLTGVLQGEQENGRWRVSERSVTEFRPKAGR